MSTIEILMEKAVQSDSEHESLACLKKAQQLYSGQPIQLPRRVKPARSTEVSVVNAVHVRELDTQRTSLMQHVHRAQKEARVLSEENDRIRNAMVKLTIKNEELVNAAKTSRQSAVAAWIVAAVATITFIMVL